MAVLDLWFYSRVWTAQQLKSTTFYSVDFIYFYHSNWINSILIWVHCHLITWWWWSWHCEIEWSKLYYYNYINSDNRDNVRYFLSANIKNPLRVGFRNMCERNLGRGWYLKSRCCRTCKHNIITIDRVHTWRKIYSHIIILAVQVRQWRPVMPTDIMASPET